MAILDSNSFGWVICHETFINKIYDPTDHEGKLIRFSLNPVLFDILMPFRKKKNRVAESTPEIKLIQRAYESLYELYVTKNHQNKQGSNQEAKKLAEEFYDESFQYPESSFLGGNKDDQAIISAVGGEHYLFPKKCEFFSYDIKDIKDQLKNRSFHFILMDPPWWNKFIRRKRKANAKFGYTMLYDTDLINIPIGSLLRDDGLIGIWCTSAPSHINAVLNVLFPAWNIEFLSQWFWLKVTKCGRLVTDFAQFLGKQPYERIIFGMKKSAIRNYPSPENNRVIMSIPSAIHSHKPPLADLLQRYLPEDANCLELFARYLLPNWTSYGNEVLKLQHMSLYCKADE